MITKSNVETSVFHLGVQKAEKRPFLLLHDKNKKADDWQIHSFSWTLRELRSQGQQSIRKDWCFWRGMECNKPWFHCSTYWISCNGVRKLQLQSLINSKRWMLAGMRVWMLWGLLQTEGLFRNPCILFSMGCSWERQIGKPFLQWRPSGEEDVAPFFPISPTDQKAPASVIRVPNSIAFRPQLKNPLELWKRNNSKIFYPLVGTKKMPWARRWEMSCCWWRSRNSKKCPPLGSSDIASAKDWSWARTTENLPRSPPPG